MSIYLQTTVVGSFALHRSLRSIYEYKGTSPKVKIHSRIFDMWSWQIQHRSTGEQVIQKSNMYGSVGMHNAWLLLCLTCVLERKEECSAVDGNLLSDGGKYLRQFKYSDQNKFQKYGEIWKC
jgi:hypothetical protein